MTGEQWVAVASGVNTALLAWVAVWQGRAAREVRKANGTLVELVERSDARAGAVEALFEVGERDHSQLTDPDLRRAPSGETV